MKRVFFEKENGAIGTIYGADNHGCNKFKIMTNIPSNSYLWFCNSNENDVMIVDDLDIEILKSNVEDLYIVNIDLSDFIGRWIHYFGGLDLE